MSRQLTLGGIERAEQRTVPDSGHAAARLTMAKSGSKRAAYRAKRVSVDSVEGISQRESKKLTLAERMRILRNEHGFLPVSTLEATQGIRLLQEIGKPTSTIVYLNEIFRRQSKEEVDIDYSERTPQHVVLDFANHRDDAKLSRIILKSVVSGLSAVLNPGLTLNLVDEIPKDNIIPVYRHHLLEQFVALPTADYRDAPGTVMTRNLMTEPVEGDFSNALEQFMGEATVLQARNLASLAFGEQNLRAEFWNARGLEAYNHLPSRPSVVRLFM